MHKVLAFSLVSLGLSACNNHTDDSPSKIINMKDNHKQHEKLILIYMNIMKLFIN